MRHRARRRAVVLGGRLAVATAAGASGGRQEGDEAAAQKMVAESVRLRDARRSKDAAATEAVMKDFGRNACGSCHTPLRVSPPAR